MAKFYHSHIKLTREKEWSCAAHSLCILKVYESMDYLSSLSLSPLAEISSTSVSSCPLSNGAFFLMHNARESELTTCTSLYHVQGW